MALLKRSLAILACVVGGDLAAITLVVDGYTDAAIAIAIGSGLVAGWFARSSHLADLLAWAAAIVLLSVTAMQWQIADKVTVFGLYYAQTFAWTFQVVLFALAVPSVFARWRLYRWRALRPLAIGTAAVALWAAVPWTRLDLAVVWRIRRAGFDQVVAQVRRGQLTGHGLTNLPSRYRSLSSNGQVWICGSGDSATVLFLTFAGILSHFSGFVHVNPDVPPSGACFGADHVNVIKRAPNWYFLASY